jgi:apolipoprotein N-acyltransferase
MKLRGGATHGVMICYESAYPEVARGFVAGGARMLVNCSNYGWFAGTSEMPQALAICALRSAELRRSLVLSSNNGISAVIGPDGRVRGAGTTADEPAYLIASAPLCASTSPFAAVGEWAAWILGLAGAAACFVLSRSAKAIDA